MSQTYFEIMSTHVVIEDCVSLSFELRKNDAAGLMPKDTFNIRQRKTLTKELCLRISIRYYVRYNFHTLFYHGTLSDSSKPETETFDSHAGIAGLRGTT
jgi:hypothetical protein